MEIITKALYWISTGLMIPVVVLLLIFFVQALVLIGTFRMFRKSSLTSRSNLFWKS